jgi:beta-ribofuranosylaminobenzene 5'-phosphate synthase
MHLVRVISRPRIHIGLVDLSGASLRSYGGVGFAINALPTIWSVRESETTELHGIENLDDDAKRDLAYLKERLEPFCAGSGYHATLEGVAQQHIGLGTKTTICMSLITAVNGLKNLNLSKPNMISLSGRGGASGVGINLFFTGGLIWDGGHKHRAGQPFLPSGAQSPHMHPPLLARWMFPERWRTALMLPKGRLANGQYEKQFFQQNTPVPRLETLETMAIMYHGIVPGFVTQDAELLREALRDLHKVGFKKRELFGQPEETRNELNYLQANTNFPVGMSSMGPLLYAIVPKDDATADGFLMNVCATHGLKFLGVYDAWNSDCELIRI